MAGNMGWLATTRCSYTITAVSICLLGDDMDVRPERGCSGPGGQRQSRSWLVDGTPKG